MIPQYDEFGNPIYDETPWEPFVPPTEGAGTIWARNHPGIVWTDPDNAPPDWLHDRNKTPPPAPTGSFWTFEGDHWTLKPSLRDTDPNPGKDGAPGSQTASSGAPYPPTTTGGDYHLPSGGPGNVGGYPGSIGFNPDAFNWPTLDIPEYTNPYGDYVPTEWIAPKPEDVRDDPSYQFRLDESMKPMVNQRALQGLTRGGATMKALAKYAGNFASDEFGRIYDRAADTYDRVEKNRKGAFDTNVDNWNTGYGYKVDEAKLEFAPKFDAAKLQFAQNFDIWKYLNDDRFRYWNSALSASTQGSQFGNDEP